MRRLLPLLLLVLALSSCSRPHSREYFIRSDKSGEYSFELEMADSLSSYDISFYTVIDRLLLGPDTLRCFPMQIVWRSPSGRYFSETVYYPADSLRVRYRSGMVPSEPGIWSLGVTISPEPQGLRGLGVIISE